MVYYEQIYWVILTYSTICFVLRLIRYILINESPFSDLNVEVCGRWRRVTGDPLELILQNPMFMGPPGKLNLRRNWKWKLWHIAPIWCKLFERITLSAAILTLSSSALISLFSNNQFLHPFHHLHHSFRHFQCFVSKTSQRILPLLLSLSQLTELKL